MKILAMKCASCGAGLQITPEMDHFTCSYCGTAQVVQRSGGTVVLKVVTDAIAKVQTGTDRTAAELALVRLKSELAEIDQRLADPHASLPNYNDVIMTATARTRTRGWTGGELLAMAIFALASIFLFGAVQVPGPFSAQIIVCGLLGVIMYSAWKKCGPAARTERRSAAVNAAVDAAVNAAVGEHTAALRSQRATILRHIKENRDFLTPPARTDATNKRWQIPQ